MNTLKLASAAAAAVIAFGIPSFALAAMSEANCTTLWQTTDANADGTLSNDESAAFHSKLTAKQVTGDASNITSRSDFMAACQNGAFDGLDK